MSRQLYLNFIKDNRWKYIVNGLGTTLQITFFAVILGIALGFLIAVIRSTYDKTGKGKILNFLAKVYLTVIRGTPVLVQLLIIYFVVFASVDINKIIVAVMAFGINSGAYVAEIIRSGIMSIDDGQFEAGRSLGFNYTQTMIYIILPQAYRNVIPTLLSQVITTIKDSSYLANVATIELMARTKQLLSAASRYNGTGNVNVSDVFVLFGVAALIYFIINYTLSCVVRSMQKRRKRPVRVVAD